MSERESSDRNATVFRSVSCSVHVEERKRETEKGGGKQVNQATVCGKCDLLPFPLQSKTKQTQCCTLSPRFAGH